MKKAARPTGRPITRKRNQPGLRKGPATWVTGRPQKCPAFYVDCEMRTATRSPVPQPRSRWHLEKKGYKKLKRDGQSGIVMLSLKSYPGRLGKDLHYRRFAGARAQNGDNGKPPNLPSDLGGVDATTIAKAHRWAKTI